MSTTARKARKRDGIPFSKAPRVGTPFEERAENQSHAMGGTAWARQPRFGVTSRIAARLRARGTTDEVSE